MKIKPGNETWEVTREESDALYALLFGLKPSELDEAVSTTYRDVEGTDNALNVLEEIRSALAASRK